MLPSVLPILFQMLGLGLGFQVILDDVGEATPSKLRRVDGLQQYTAGDAAFAIDAKAVVSSETPSNKNQLASHKMPDKTQLPRTHEILAPPVQTLNVEDANKNPRSKLVIRSGAPHLQSTKAKSKTEAQPKLETMQGHIQKAAEGWTPRGLKALPVISDPRFTHNQKEKELERLMKKLHKEFFMKQDMGHSRLAQARAMFYAAVNDYKQLTGVVPDINDLPGAADSIAGKVDPEVAGNVAGTIKDRAMSEHEDGSSANGNEVGEHTPISNVVLVPDKFPPCVVGCVSGQDGSGAPEPPPRCRVNASTWTVSDACECYKAFQKCGIADCTEVQRDTSGFFTALDTREAEVCAWPDSDELIYNLHLGDIHKPDGSVRFEDDYSGSSAVGYTNAPNTCTVSHPEMLGDGSCDGGTYNTEACNFDGGDCCDTDCRPARHHCGINGYQCKGTRTAARVGDTFTCSKSKAANFNTFYDKLRDQLTLGKSRGCSQLVEEEHQNVAQAFNLGVELQWKAGVTLAESTVGGPSLFMSCDLWDDHMCDDWFGTILSHELGHIAGYGNSAFEDNLFESECENIGSDYCTGHCVQWLSACETHAHFGSQVCGNSNIGCSTTCVNANYCYSMPERITECLGFQKVHSRDASYDSANLTAVCSGAHKPVALPISLGLLAVLFLASGSRQDF